MFDMTLIPNMGGGMSGEAGEAGLGGSVGGLTCHSKQLRPKRQQKMTKSDGVEKVVADLSERAQAIVSDGHQQKWIL